jgi:hypothetical protein
MRCRAVPRSIRLYLCLTLVWSLAERIDSGRLVGQKVALCGRRTRGALPERNWDWACGRGCQQHGQVGQPHCCTCTAPETAVVPDHWQAALTARRRSTQARICSAGGNECIKRGAAVYTCKATEWVRELGIGLKNNSSI